MTETPTPSEPTTRGIPAETFTAEVIQYIRPHGHTRIESTNLPLDYQDLYVKMRDKGWNFAAECMEMNNLISLWIEDKPNEEDIDQELVTNGPNVQQALCDMLVRTLGEPGSGEYASQTDSVNGSKTNESVDSMESQLPTDSTP